MPCLYGTMIEIPRACLLADQMAKTAQFFSFGTNDLTQMCFGFSRDDIGGFLHDYLEDNILAADPFQTIDQGGVGQLIQMAVIKGRSARGDLKIGICGEQGGDPASVEFCFRTRAELRQLQPVPRAHRPAGGRPGGHQGEEIERLTVYKKGLGRQMNCRPNFLRPPWGADTRAMVRPPLWIAIRRTAHTTNAAMLLEGAAAPLGQLLRRTLAAGRCRLTWPQLLPQLLQPPQVLPPPQLDRSCRSRRTTCRNRSRRTSCSSNRRTRVCLLAPGRIGHEEAHHRQHRQAHDNSSHGTVSSKNRFTFEKRLRKLPNHSRLWVKLPSASIFRRQNQNDLTAYQQRR